MVDSEHVITNKGLAIQLRPVRPEDAGYLVDIFEHMGAESRYNRFNQMLASPDPVLVQRTALEMARKAPQVGQAWLAFAEVPGEGMVPIGGARYARPESHDDETLGELPDGASAEVSVVVRDDFQQQGVGMVLLARTLQAARTAGIRVLYGIVRQDNLPLKALVKKLPCKVSWKHDGSVAIVIIDLDQLQLA